MKFFRRHKKTILALSSIPCVLIVVLLVVNVDLVQVHAGILDDALTVIEGGMVELLRALITLIIGLLTTVIEFLGRMLSVVVSLLKSVAEYNGYRAQEQVIVGWKIVRDVVNSFYVVVFIVIALATIIRWPKEYDFRTALPRLLLSAVIVNFSRTIVLLAIAFADSVMITFLNAVSNAWPAFVLGLRAPSIVALDPASIKATVSTSLGTASAVGASIGDIMVAQLFAIATLFIALFALFAMLLILLIRIIALWVLIILSPLAFFLWGVPGSLGEHFKEWKKEFIAQLIVGPVLAFFIYIIILFFIQNATSTGKVYGITVDGSTGAPRPSASFLSDPTQLLGYVVGITLMFVAMEVALKIGARGTSGAGKASTWLRKKLQSGARKVGGYAAGKTIDAARGTAGLVGSGLFAATGIDFNQKIPGGGLRGGVQSLRTALDSQGRNVASARVERLEEAGHGRRAMIAAAAGGKEITDSYIKDNGFKGIVKRLVGKEYSGEATEELEGDMTGIRARNALRNSGDLGVAGLQTMHELSNDIDGSKGELHNMREQRTADFAELQGLRSAEAGGEALADDQVNRAMELEEQFNEAAEYSADSDEELVALESEIETKEAILGQARDAGVGGTQRINDRKAEISSEQAIQDDKDRSDVISLELQNRNTNARKAGAPVRQADKEKGNKYRDNTYEKDERASIEQLSANARSNANARNIPEFQEDLIKAADQGGFDNVMLQLDAKFTMDDAGMQKAKDYFTSQGDYHPKTGTKKGVGMTESQALRIFEKVQGRNWADKKAIQTGFVVEDKQTGKRKFASESERRKVIISNIENNTADVLSRGKKDAIGVKQKDGSYKMHSAAIEAFRASKGRLNGTRGMLNNPRIQDAMDKETLHMLRDNAKAIGLDASSVELLNSKLG